MNRIALALTLLLLASPAQAQSMKFYVIDNGAKIAGPFDDYYSCSKMMDILKTGTTDALVCMER